MPTLFHDHENVDLGCGALVIAGPTLVVAVFIFLACPYETLPDNIPVMRDASTKIEGLNKLFMMLFDS